MAFEETITVFRGESILLQFTMSPIEDITDWTIEFTVEGSPQTPKKIQKPATVTDGPSGLFEVTLTAVETDLRVGSYQYDAFRTDVGSQRALAVGAFIVRDVARLPA